MSKLKPKKEVNPPQEQPRPGLEEQMKPVPETNPLNRGSGKLQSKKVLITGEIAALVRQWRSCLPVKVLQLHFVI
ncbi:hypothetical protein [Niabella hibiscisoli]|uniref:hypothetical protein n=1 Tax=Niabella hibiscisoli TaxID=1825928 RepID=UPI001F0D6B3F|nr:hypothetical protein [Niabella hibiscisoli]MCH5718750.1 hypothetical protein [Niabella hibiscisoli]